MGYNRELLESRQYRVIIDPISLVCIFGSFFVLGMTMFSFLPTIHENPKILDIFLKSAVLFLFLIGGLVAMLFTGIYDPRRKGDTDWLLDAKELDMILLWTGVSLMMIMFINYITFQYSPMFQSAVNPDIAPGSLMTLYLMLSLMSGWTEEVVFRGFALRFIQKVTLGDDIAAIVISTLLWWGFHWGVYGLALTPMLIILMSGFMLSISMIITEGRLSVVMAPHGINNMLAWATSGAILTRVAFLVRLVIR